jgi:peptide/nickel transport system permease protein
VLLLNFTVGVWLGVRQAVRRDKPEDQALTVLSLAAYATPSFWLGLVLAWLVGVKWHLLPAAGMMDPLLEPDAGFLARAADVGRHLVLPALTLSIVSIAGTMRYQRTAMIEVLHLPYIVTARAKGLPEGTVTWKHAWRNAFFPVLTLFGLWLPLLVTGSVFVESVFAWPGLGSLAVGAVGYRDYPVLMGSSLLVAVVVVGGSLLMDVAYALLDPRVRLS